MTSIQSGPADSGRVGCAETGSREPGLASRPGPSGFDPAREPRWPLNKRHMRLPKWAQDEIHGLLCDQITADFDACINGEVRRMAKRVLGGNCTFADDDLHLMALLAEAAIDAGLHEQISDRWTKANIEQAKARRARERNAIATEAGTAETPQSGSVHEGAGPKVIAHD